MIFFSRHLRFKKGLMVFLASVFIFTSTLTFFPKKSEACCFCFASVVQEEILQTFKSLLRLIGHMLVRVELHQRIFMKHNFWGYNISIGLKDVGEQLAAIAMGQTMMVGKMIDASYQMETQQVMQALQAKSHKNYHPSIGMCEFISSARSLADSERKAQLNQKILSQRNQDRILGHAYTSGSWGAEADKLARVEQFRETFCKPEDHNGALASFCVDKVRDANDFERMNKDIDFARTLDTPYTLDIDFTDNILTDNEEEIIALSSNLYAHDIFKGYSKSELKQLAGDGGMSAKKKYLDQRALAAKLSVAENTFNAIAGLKSAGAPNAKEFMDAVFKQLNVLPQDLDRLVGEKPSYYAQMEVLTKKLLQNPDFYTNLYDKPANVERKGAALQAIGLMQKFDLFKSHLRNEANLSLLLEIAVADIQDTIKKEASRNER